MKKQIKLIVGVIITVVILLSSLFYITYPSSLLWLINTHDKIFFRENIIKDYHIQYFEKVRHISHSDKIILDPNIVNYYLEGDYIFILQDLTHTIINGKAVLNERGSKCNIFIINHVTEQLIGPISVNYTQATTGNENKLNVRAFKKLKTDIHPLCKVD